MTVEAVKQEIDCVQARIEEWNKEGFRSWREVDVRYAIIDPIIRALGWNTADPKECHPEWPFPEKLRADYALFRNTNISCKMPPFIIIEAKALSDRLDDKSKAQLGRYAKASPRMKEGVAVLTNGREWQLYCVGPRGGLGKTPDITVDILKGDNREAAQTLDEWLGRNKVH